MTGGPPKPALKLVADSEMDRHRVKLDIQRLAGREMRGRLQVSLGDDAIQEPFVIDRISHTDLWRHGELVIQTESGRGRAAGIGDRGQLAGTGFLAEVGIGQAESDIRTNCRLGFQKAILQEQRWWQYVRRADFAAALDRTITEEFMGVRPAEVE